MLVKEIMSTNVITVSPETSLKELGQLIKDKKISGVPVVDESESLIGVITITDLLRLLNQIYQWKKLEKGEDGPSLRQMLEQEKTNAKVKDLMTKSILALSEDDTLDEVMKKMFDNKIHTLPVISDGKIVGVIGKKDLIKACF